MRKHGTIYITCCVILLTLTILRASSRSKGMSAPEPASVKTETAAVGINHRIENSMSNLEETKRFERDVERFMSQWEITGASVAIMKDGNLIYCKGFGMADVDRNEPMQVSHIMRVASVSKLITATTIMKLTEEGKLSLSDKVFGANGILNDTAFLNIPDKNVYNITVEHLLRHRGGFSLRAGDPMFSAPLVARRMGKSMPLSLDDMVQCAASTRLRYRPGSSNIYSNLGYVVLSKVIEKVTGEKYEQYVQKHILEPAGCHDMHLGHSFEAMRHSNEVCYYEPSDAEQVECFDGSGRMVDRRYGGCDIEVLSGAGGWVASPAELLKFITAIDYKDSKPDILSRASIDKMTGYSKDIFPIGWMRTTKDGSWMRSGSLAGSSAMIKRQNNGYTWIFVTNTSSWSGSKFIHKIDGLMRNSMPKVKAWPDRDMFSN